VTGRGLSLAAAALAFAFAAPAAALPTAIAADPPIDAAHPASGGGVQFVSHGARVNAQLYLPAGAGPHPAVILLHGLPGNEQNLDLARAMQRAGWAVVTFHYRGSWGSGGTFTLEGGCDDVDALLADIEGPGGAAEWHIDPKRIVIMGHSYGGYVAACATGRHPSLLATGLIAPWDPSADVARFAAFPADQVAVEAPKIFNDVDGRLTGIDAAGLMNAVRDRGAALDLAAAALALARRPLLIATATRDDPDDQAIALLAALPQKQHAPMVNRRFDTDHGFNDQRIALETYVLDWLATLPDAPAPQP
jgi:pimeloyl-ACP methyl ester carboxylesterase